MPLVSLSLSSSLDPKTNVLSDVSSLANPADAMVSGLIHAFSAYFDKSLYPQAIIVLLHYIRPARVKRSNIYTSGRLGCQRIQRDEQFWIKNERIPHTIQDAGQSQVSTQ